MGLYKGQVCEVLEVRLGMVKVKAEDGGIFEIVMTSLVKSTDEA